MRFGLLGRKLGHSYSPQIHSLLGNYEYPLYEKEPEEIEEFMTSDDFDGMNVTIPYKETVIPYMSQLSETAKKIGSVNTVKRLPDGKLYGDNTDYYGFSYMLDSAGFDVTDKKVIVLGNGGASKTAVCVCRDKGAKEVTVISRRSETDNYQNIAKHSDADYIINTTPVGMYPNNGESPVDLQVFNQCKGVADLIYNPSKTQLLLDAEKLSIPYVNGLTMLCAQAVKAAEIFTNQSFIKNKATEITQKLEQQMLNIVLVGMPGCGKSTAAKSLAEILGREVIDTDELIKTNEGREIPEIFSTEGEEYFRNAETTAVKFAGKQSGKIIATGGGAILSDENKDALRQNSVVIFLKRDISQLDTEGRPLSINNPLEEMYKKRLPHYEAVCDITVEVAHDKQETAIRILKGLGLI
ncbi:MAG: AAA family ATPase [Clostridia bacterium]|nr:AAA family ATPase [Clostridia bacterium]